MFAYFYLFFEDNPKNWPRLYAVQSFVDVNPSVIVVGIRAPITVGTFLTNPRKFFRFFFSPLEKIGDRLFAWTMLSFLPIRLLDKHKILDLFFGWTLTVQFAMFLRFLNVSKCAFWLCTLTRVPFYFCNLRIPVVYDCHDNEIYAGNRLDCSLKEIEDEIIQKSGVFFAVSKLNFEEKKAKAKHAYYIPQGVSTHFFNSTAPLPISLNLFFSKTRKPVVGYVGNVRDWLDFELLMKMVKYYSKVSFVFVGNIDSAVIRCKERLALNSNVYFLGRQDSSVIPAIIREFAVGLIPFRNNRFNLSTAPYKFMEYMALGKPVVSLNIHELRYCRDYIFLYESHESALSQLGSALLLADDQTAKNKRIEIAGRFSIDKISQKYHDALKECLLEE